MKKHQTMWGAKILGTILVLLLGALSTPTMGISQRITDGIVAKVGNDIILLSEVMEYGELQAYNLGLDPYSNPEEFRKILTSVLQRLIDQRIILAEAKEDSIRLETYEVDEAMQEQIDSLISQFGSQSALESELHMSVADIKREFRDDVRNRLLVQRYKEKFLGMITINPEEIKQFYQSHKDSLPELPERVNLSQIVINIPETKNADSLAVDELRGIRQMMNEGQSFGDLARLYSEDTTTSRQGGELGLIPQASLTPEFKKALVALQPGEVSDIIKTDFGYYLVQLEERQGNQIRARQILVKPKLPEMAVLAALDTLKSLRAQVMGGIPFDSLAGRYAKVQNIESNLGWISVPSIDNPVFQSVLDTLKVGEVSRPFQTDAEWRIIRLNGVKPAKPLTLEENYQTIRQFALKAKQEREYKKLLQQLRSQYYVKVNKAVIDQFLQNLLQTERQKNNHG